MDRAPDKYRIMNNLYTNIHYGLKMEKKNNERNNCHPWPDPGRRRHYSQTLRFTYILLEEYARSRQCISLMLKSKLSHTVTGKSTFSILFLTRDIVD